MTEDDVRSAVLITRYLWPPTPEKIARDVCEVVMALHGLPPERAPADAWFERFADRFRVASDQELKSALKANLAAHFAETRHYDES